MFRHVVSLTLGLTVAAVACNPSPSGADGGTSGSTGSATSSSGGGTGGVSGTTACSDYANALCNLYTSCSDQWYADAVYGDVATCVSRNQAQCAARLAVPETAQSPSLIESCAQSLQAGSCEALYGSDTIACSAPTGTFAAAAPCEASAQCASAYCGIARDALCGTCQAAPMQGGDCSVFACGPGLRCLSGVKTCAPAVADGGACKADDDCQFGLTCLGKGLFCAPTTASGQPCDATGKVGPGCNDRQGLVCQKQADGGVCALKQLAAAGQPCGNVNGNGVDTNCLATGLCQESDAGTGLCVAAIADGTGCLLDAGPSCLPPARCVPSGAGPSGVCSLPLSGSCGTSGGSTSGGTGGGSGAVLCTATNTTLLVDNDDSDNNNAVTTPMLSAGDVIYPAVLADAGVAGFACSGGSCTGNIFVVPGDSNPNPGNQVPNLTGCNTVVWYTGSDTQNPGNVDPPITTGAGSQDAALISWLNGGGKTLYIFSQGILTSLLSTAGGSDQWGNEEAPLVPPIDPLLQAIGGANIVGADWDSSDVNPPITVNATSPFPSPLDSWSLAAQTSFTNPNLYYPDFSYVGLINPGSGVKTLGTLLASDPLTSGPVTAAIVTVNQAAGAAGTSTVVFVGFPAESILPPPGNTIYDLYAGLSQFVTGH